MSGTFCEELALRVLCTKGTGHLFPALAGMGTDNGNRVAINCRDIRRLGKLCRQLFPVNQAFRFDRREHLNLAAKPSETYSD